MYLPLRLTLDFGFYAALSGGASYGITGSFNRAVLSGLLGGSIGTLMRYKGLGEDYRTASWHEGMGRSIFATLLCTAGTTLEYYY